MAQRGRNETELLELSKLFETGHENMLERALDHVRKLGGADVAAIGPLDGRSFQLQAHAGTVSPTLLEAMRRGVMAGRPLLKRLGDGEMLEITETASNPNLSELNQAGVRSVLLNFVRISESPICLALFRLAPQDEFGSSFESEASAVQSVGNQSLQTARHVAHWHIPRLDG